MQRDHDVVLSSDVLLRAQQREKSDELVGHILLASIGSITQSAAGVHIETCRGVAFDMTSQSMIESSSALWFGEHLPTPPPDTLSAAPTTHTLYLHYA